MTGVWMEASLVIAVATIALAAFLLVIYRTVYARSKSKFGLALVLFAGAFVAQSVLTLVSYVVMMPIVPADLAPFLFATGLCEATGLSAAAWTASR